MVLKDLMRGTTFLIETSSDSKCILNKKSGKLLWFEIRWDFMKKILELRNVIKFD
jgi:hypothetical protein